MSPEKKGILTWNVEELAKALKISIQDVREYFTDGRRVSFIIERRVSKEIMKGKLASSEGAGFDLFDVAGGKWEVRSISRGGIYFCPSYMVGSGRKFDVDGFLKKISEIKGYIISDIESFPSVPVWIVSKEEVLKWWENGDLGKNTKISKEKILELVNGGD